MDCPKCGKHGKKKFAGYEPDPGNPNKMIIRRRCEKCGSRWTETHEKNGPGGIAFPPNDSE